LIATLTKAFSELRVMFKYVHCAELCAVALSVVLLMTPAAVHRIVFDGEDHPAFFRIGSSLVICRRDSAGGRHRRRRRRGILQGYGKHGCGGRGRGRSARPPARFLAGRFGVAATVFVVPEPISQNAAGPFLSVG
jgi:hypothetical protein